jgi:hypothetical protein
MRSGALDYILKPFNVSTIIPVLSRALAMRLLRLENASLLQRVADRSAALEGSNCELRRAFHRPTHHRASRRAHRRGRSVGKGAKFTFTLPVSASRGVDRESPQARVRAEQETQFGGIQANQSPGHSGGHHCGHFFCRPHWVGRCKGGAALGYPRAPAQ